MKVRIIDTTETCRHIKQLLEDRGYRPEQIRNLLQLQSVQSVYKWYKTARGGKSKTIPSIDNLIMLSDILQVSLEDLLELKYIELPDEECI